MDGLFLRVSENLKSARELYLICPMSLFHKWEESERPIKRVSDDIRYVISDIRKYHVVAMFF